MNADEWDDLLYDITAADDGSTRRVSARTKLALKLEEMQRELEELWREHLNRPPEARP